MNFSLTEEQRRVQELAREFTKKEVAPYIVEWDRQERYPLKEMARKLGTLGLTGGVVPEAYGGAAMDFLTYTVLVEEIAKTAFAVAVLASFSTGLIGTGLMRYGTEAQRRKYLVSLCRGEMVAAGAITEPHSGTDVATMETTARREGDDYIINGAKVWISNLLDADYIISLATLDKALGTRGICAFIFEKGTPGLSVHQYRNVLGLRPLPHGEVVFQDCRVPRENLLGQEGEGLRVALSAVGNERLGVAGRACGMAQTCLEESAKYAQSRIVFGQPIGRYQLIQSKITDMVVGVEAGRLLTYRAAWLRDQGETRATRETSIAKLFATETLMRTATEAVQIFGAYGCSDEYQVSRLFRDAKVLQIIVGTNELHRILIAEMALGYRKG